MKTFIGTMAVIWLAYLAIWILCVVAMGYVAYEILFTDALNRWFG